MRRFSASRAGSGSPIASTPSRRLTHSGGRRCWLAPSTTNLLYQEYGRSAGLMWVSSETGPSIASTMTLDRMAQDGIELSECLRKHLGKGRIVLVAHSFGSILGLRMVQARPDLFYAYVCTGQVSDETKNYSVAYAALLEKSQASGNQQAVAE